MTLARLLRLRGFSPVVIERMPEGHYIPRGYMLGFQGYEPLEEVGVYEEVRAAGLVARVTFAAHESETRGFCPPRRFEVQLAGAQQIPLKRQVRKTRFRAKLNGFFVSGTVFPLT